MRFLGWERSDGNNDRSAAGSTKPIRDHGVALLVITRDPELYEKLREIACGWKWTIHQTAEVNPSVAACFSDSISIKIVVYDGDSIEGDWKDALAGIKLWEKQPCVLLASRVSDRYLWDEVVRCGGHDIIAKSAERQELMRTLRFAWFWKKTLQPCMKDTNKAGLDK
jgi:hypothetical protein